MRSLLNMRAVCAAGAIVALILAGRVSGADFHGQVDNPLQNIPAVSDYQTDGADMAGMSVTAFFTLAPPETVIWNATGPAAGAAVGPSNDWRLHEAGDTFMSPWTLEYNSGASPVPKGLLTGIRIDGFAAGGTKVGVMFDRTFDGVFGTPNSFLGHDYETLIPVPFDSFVVYEGAIGVAGNAPVGDEFRWLNVRFRVLPGVDDEFSTVPPQIVGLDGEQLRAVQFRQDTNNPELPEPASLTIFGVAALALLRRR